MYRRIDLEMWGDEKFRALSRPAPSAQGLWQYLLTGPPTTPIPGVLITSLREICGQLRWPFDTDSAPDSFWTEIGPVGIHRGYARGARSGLEAMAELEAVGMVRRDEDARVIWLPNAIKRAPIAGPNNVAGWRNWWAMVPPCKLKTEIRTAFVAHFRRGGKTDQLSAFIQFAEGGPPPPPGRGTEGGPEGGPGGGVERGPGGGGGLTEIRDQRSRDSEKRGARRRRAQTAAPGGAAPSSGAKSDHQVFIDAFDVAFAAARGGDRPKWGAKPGRQVADLLKLPGGLADALARMERMFARAPAWPAEDPDLATLVGHWDKFAAPPDADVRSGSVRPKDFGEYPEPGEDPTF